MNHPTWVKQFSIGHVIIRIHSAESHFEHAIHLLTQLYQSNQQPQPNLSFRIDKKEQYYTLYLGDEVIWKSEDSRDIAPAFEFALYQRTLQQLETSLISIHASSITYAQHTIMFAGRSGAGKSSLCTAALWDGASYITDEFSLLSQTGHIHPFPRPLQWDDINHPAFEVNTLLNSGLFQKGEFSFPNPDGDILTSHLWLPSHVQHQKSPMNTVILPQYHANHPAAALKPIRRSEALMLLTEHLHTRASFSQMFKELHQRLPQQLHFYQLHFSDVVNAWATVKQSCCQPTTTSNKT
ncbi:MAG: hypothetical protein Q9M19_06355 [Mariprofundaceae bacterium]|nr:hypothetical protein [Mariprofundaceae bacterium]